MSLHWKSYWQACEHPWGFGADMRCKYAGCVMTDAEESSIEIADAAASKRSADDGQTQLGIDGASEE